MNENDENFPGFDEKVAQTVTEQVAEDKIFALERELALLQPGTAVILERLKPSWCKGQLEKVTIGDDGLDLDYLIRTWGGHLLSLKIVGSGNRIKGSHTVELYTFEPRRWGKKLIAPNRMDDDESPPIQNPVMMQPPPSQELALIPQFLEMLNTSRQNEMDTLRTLLLNQQQQQPAPAATPMGGIGDIVKMATAMNQLKEMFRAEKSTDDQPEQFPAQVMDMVKVFLDSKNSQPQTRLVAPVQQVPQQAPPPSRARVPVAVPSPPLQGNSTSKPMNEQDIISNITAMAPAHAAETLITALGKMPPDKQSECLAEFMGRFNESVPEYAQGSDEYGPIDDEEYEDEENEGAGGN